MIPKNINKEHVLQALNDIDKNGVQHPLTKSRKYDLIYKEKAYPPKLAISLSNQFANGEYLTHDKFNSIEAREILEKLDPEFRIQQKKTDPLADLIEKYKQHVKRFGIGDE